MVAGRGSAATIARTIAETPRLSLRHLREDDAGFLLRLVNEEAFRTHIGEKHLHTDEDARRFIREGPWTCQPRAGYAQFLVESRDTGEALGVCGLLYREELDVSDVPPTLHSIPMDAPLRPDVPVRCSDRAETLAQAPESEAGGFAVPLVLEVDS